MTINASITSIGDDRNKVAHLCIDFGSLVEALPEHVRSELVAWAMADDGFLRTVCMAVATADQATTLPNPPADCWHNQETKDALRAALAPILGPAVKDTIDKALASAEKNRRAAEELRSLVHVNAMYRADPFTRGEQMEQEWRNANALFPDLMTPEGVLLP